MTYSFEDSNTHSFKDNEANTDLNFNKMQF